MSGKEVVVLKIGTRYFYRFGKNGRVLTAWSLAGAKLFQMCDFEEIYHKIQSSGKQVRAISIRDDSF